MMKNTFGMMGLVAIACALSACVIKHHDDCWNDPYCDGYPPPGDVCFCDDDCPSGSFCSGTECVGSATCPGNAFCGLGYHCDHRSTCVPGNEHQGSGGGSGGWQGGWGSGGAARGSGGAPQGSGGAPQGSGGAAPGSGGAVGTGGTSGGQSCTGNADCAASDCCVSGTCQPRAGMGIDVPVCRFDSECGGGARCKNGGCQRGCAASSDCGTGDICVGGFCQENPASGGQCVYNADCATVIAGGGVCFNGACHPACASDLACGPRDRCTSGFCRADDRPRPQCRANADCSGGQICVNAVCRSECASSQDCCTCGSATVCQGGLCVTPGEAAPQCRVQSDCGGTQSCVDALCAM